MGHVVRADARARQRGPGRRGHGGGAPQLGMSRHVDRVLGVAPAAQVDPPLLGHAERVRLLGAGHHDGRCHVDVHDRGHQLRVRVGHHAVVRRGRLDLRHAARRGEPGVRWLRSPAATAVMADMIRPSASRCSPSARPRWARARIVEQGEGQVRLEHRVADLRGVELHVHREGALLCRPVRPLRPLARLLQPAHGGEGLRAGEEREVEVGRPGSPAPPRRPGPTAPSHRCPSSGAVRGRAEPLGQPRRRVVVLPRLCVDDVDALERPPQGVCAGRAPASAAAARATRSHMSSGSGARPPASRTSASSGCQRVARHADDAGSPGIGGAHGSNGAGDGALRRGTCRAWRWPGRR